MWCEPAEIEWARRVISIVACCHSVKLCALACSGFPITTMWCFLLGPGCEYGARCNLNKKNVRLSASLQKGGNVGATFQLVLHRKCDSPQTGCAQTATHKYMWREQEKIEWSHRIISIVACCHSVITHQPEALHICRSSFLIATQEIYFLVFCMPNTWKWPEMNMYLDLDLNLATFQHIDGFGCYHFCLNRFGLELMIFFWTSSQLSVNFRSPLSPAKATFHVELCNPVTRQAIELKNCSNPLRIQQVLQSKSKTNFSFSVGFFRGRTPQVGCFWPPLPGPGP